ESLQGESSHARHSSRWAGRALNCCCRVARLIGYDGGMSWYGTHPGLTRDEVRRLLPPGACKFCVYWFRTWLPEAYLSPAKVNALLASNVWGLCRRCGINMKEAALGILTDTEISELD